MARLKQTIVQRDMSLMELRPEFLERDDADARMAALRTARNVRSLATGGVEQRPGLFFRRELGDAVDVVEIRPESGLAFGLIVNDTSLDVIDAEARIVHSEEVVPWTDATGVWVETFRRDTVIGGPRGIYVLRYEAGVWTFQPFAFDAVSGNEVAQPYWSFRQDTTVQPSARTGSITLTASLPIWTPAYVGQRVRYGQREVLITGFVSASVLAGTVIDQLPPTFNLTMSSTRDFRVGDAVVGATTNFNGLVVAISGSVLTVVTQAFFDGPDTSERLSSPIGSATVSAKAEVPPAASPIWDEPLMSPVRGYPRAAAAVSGRFVLIDFPQVPDLVAMSSVRSIYDWRVGLNPDDGIVRRCGDNAPRWLHAVNAEDLLLFSDRGCYFIRTRDSQALTPANFNVTRFDRRAAAPIKPVAVDDGVVFVEANGESIAAALLDGNVYLTWSVTSLTTLHNHLVRDPRKLCGPALSSRSPEKYLFVVNGDGTLAAVSWNEKLGGERVGFAPWDTRGAFVSVAPVFDGYWAVVDRQIGSATVRFLEEFSEDAFLDCAVETTLPSQFDVLAVNGDLLDVNGQELLVVEPVAGHLAGEVVAIGGADFYAGDFTVLADGSIAAEPDLDRPRQIGFRFTQFVAPWPVENLQSPRVGMLKARVIRFGVSVQESSAFRIVCNRNTHEVGGHAFGDDLSQPPPLRTRVYRVPVMGQRDHPELAVVKDTPGRLRVLAMTQEAQA